MARVLIVDDEEADRLLLQAILARAGHDTFFAESGEEAVREYRLRGIEVVVTDLQMSEGHGYELITALRDFEPRPAVIAVSGTGGPQLDMAEALGCRWTMTKPVRPEPLLQALDEALLDR